MPDSLESRITAVEHEVVDLREECTVVRRAPLNQARVLSALRTTQIEHSQLLGEHGRQLVSLHGRLDTFEREVRDGFAQVVGMLDHLIDRTDDERTDDERGSRGQ